MQVTHATPLPFNGWVARARFLFALASDATVTTILMFLLGLSLATIFGYLKVPIVERMVDKMLANDHEIITVLSRIEAQQAVDRIRRERILGILISTMKVNCENAARDAFQRNNCANIRE